MRVIALLFGLFFQLLIALFIPGGVIITALLFYASRQEGDRVRKPTLVIESPSGREIAIRLGTVILLGPTEGRRVAVILNPIGVLLLWKKLWYRSSGDLYAIFFEKMEKEK